MNIPFILFPFTYCFTFTNIFLQMVPIDGLFRSASHIFLLRLNMNHEIKTTNLFFLGDLSLVFSFIFNFVSLGWFQNFQYSLPSKHSHFSWFSQYDPIQGIQNRTNIVSLSHTHTHKILWIPVTMFSFIRPCTNKKNFKKNSYLHWETDKKQFIFNTQS